MLRVLGALIVNRPNLVGDPRVSDPTPVRFFDTDAFEAPEFGSFGNSGRNVIIGPGLANVDLALMRVFRISDLLRAQFRADFYNAFNRTNFVAPPTTQNFADSPGLWCSFCRALTANHTDGVETVLVKLPGPKG